MSECPQRRRKPPEACLTVCSIMGDCSHVCLLIIPLLTKWIYSVNAVQEIDPAIDL